MEHITRAPLGIPDKFGFGALAGVLCVALGFGLFGAYWCISYDSGFTNFVNTVFLNSDLFKTEIITLSLVPAVGLFYWAMNKDAYRFGRGIMLVLILGTLGAVIFWVSP